MFYENKISLCIERMKLIEKSKSANIFNIINNSFKQSIHDTTSFTRWIKSLNKSVHKNTIDDVCTILGIDFKRYLATNRPYLISDEIRQLARDGFTIDAHSKRHYAFDLLSYEEIEKEIVDSCKVIMDLTGEKEIPFVFPFSVRGIDRVFLKI